MSFPLIFLDSNLYLVPGQGLLKTKQNEDPGFEIIKEVQGSGKPYSSMYNNPSLSALATLMGTGAGPHSGLGGAGGLLNQNFLQKCKLYLEFLTFSLNIHYDIIT